MGGTREAGVSKDLTGKVAIITGGASGIGRALGEELARRGADVTLADRQPERMAALRTMTDLGLDAGLAREIVDGLPGELDRERSEWLRTRIAVRAR